MDNGLNDSLIRLRQTQYSVTIAHKSGHKYIDVVKLFPDVLNIVINFIHSNFVSELNSDSRNKILMSQTVTGVDLSKILDGQTKVLGGRRW